MRIDDVTFLTGNANKVNYLSEFLGRQIAYQKVDLDEIQAVDAQTIVRHKLLQAYGLMSTPVLVEDTGLYCSALGGLPGAFIKFFITADNGLENICRMLDGFEDRSAYASATYGYFDGSEMKFFTGKLEGKISSSVRGRVGYGFDPIFEPNGFDGLTRAQLEEKDNRQTYAKMKDLHNLKSFLWQD